MQRDLYSYLSSDMKRGRHNNFYVLSPAFISLHMQFMDTLDIHNVFSLSSSSYEQRKDQLLLNLQYSNLLHGGKRFVYQYDEYYRYTEEFFTYFLNYELTTKNGSHSFIQYIEAIFEILNTCFTETHNSKKNFSKQI